MTTSSFYQRIKHKKELSKTLGFRRKINFSPSGLTEVPIEWVLDPYSGSVPVSDYKITDFDFPEVGTEPKDDYEELGIPTHWKAQRKALRLYSPDDLPINTVDRIITMKEIPVEFLQHLLLNNIGSVTVQKGNYSKEIFTYFFDCNDILSKLDGTLDDSVLEDLGLDSEDRYWFVETDPGKIRAKIKSKY